MSNYDLYKNKSYNLRIPNMLREKAQIVAAIQGFDKMSHFYEHVISQYIAAYEAEHGEIILSDQDPHQNQ